MTSLLWVALLAQAYCVVYVIAAYSHLTHQGGALAPWRLRRVLLEAVGWVLRKARRLPATSRFTSNEAFFASLRLSVSSATEAQLLEKVQQVSAYLDDHRWAYPPSQRQNLRDLSVRAVQSVRLRDELLQARASVRAAAPTGWRAVLGLAPSEQDLDTIRKAYRRLRKGRHPDQGTNGTVIAELSRAMAEARKELNFV